MQHLQKTRGVGVLLLTRHATKHVYPESAYGGGVKDLSFSLHFRGRDAGHASRVTLFRPSLHRYVLTSLLLNDRETCRPCRALAWSSDAALPSLHHRRQQNSRPQSPSLRRAEVFPSDCRTLRKLSARRLSQTCNRLPAKTISPVRTRDVLARQTSHPVSPPFLCATHLAAQSAFRNRACVRPRRAARRRTSPSPFRSFRFSPPARHNWSLRTTSHPSTRDKHFGSSSPRFPHWDLRKGCLLPHTPCRRTWPSACTSLSRCESCCLSPRDSHSRAIRPSPSSRCPLRKYVPPCWDRENPRDSRSRTPRDAAPFPAPRCRLHPRAWDDTRAAIRRSERPTPDPAAAAFSCVQCAAANSLGLREARLYA